MDHVRRREDLQILLESLGGATVYFQPPANVQMNYPAIVYERDSADVTFAGNQPYNRTKRYSVMIIDRNPDNPVAEKVAELPMCRFSRHYVAENLHHDVYSLYF